MGAVIRDASGRLLLIQRGHEPGAGFWSLPGGRVEPGETHQQAVAREVLEETGLSVECGRLLGAAELPAPGGDVFEVSDYVAVVTVGEVAAGEAAAGEVAAGEVAAGDDAASARWVTAAEFASLPVTDGLAGYLTAWSVYPS